MKAYLTSKGERFSVDFFCTIEKEYENGNREGKTWVIVHSDRYGYEQKHLSVYYRHERTWDDHLGNTPCGYFVIVPLPTGERRRVYYV